MPQSVTHVIIALVVASLIRDYYVSKSGRKKFPLHYVLIAGIAGLLPDIDVAAYWILHFFGFTLSEVHRNFTHSLFVPLLFLLLAFVFANTNLKFLSKRHMDLKGVFLMIALGSFIHLVLDASMAGFIRPFYPISSYVFGFSLVTYLPTQLGNLFFPCLDAAILVIWLVYMEWKHKISDYI